MKEENKNWLDAMVEREAIPEPAREDGIDEFCNEWNIPRSNYYYHKNKKENQKKIVEAAVNNAKKYAPAVLDNLGKRAAKGKDNKATEMYLEFIAELTKKMDVKTDGEFIIKLTNYGNNDTDQFHTENLPEATDRSD